MVWEVVLIIHNNPITPLHFHSCSQGHKANIQTVCILKKNISPLHFILHCYDSSVLILLFSHYISKYFLFKRWNDSMMAAL
jgi:hypothetical protein